MKRRNKVLLAAGITCSLLAAVVAWRFFASDQKTSTNRPAPKTAVVPKNFKYPVLSEKDANSRVNIMFPLEPQAQYAGYIVALEKGFYKQAGLNNVDLQWYSEPVIPVPPLISSGGKPDFQVGWILVALKNHTDQNPLTNIAQIFQRESLVLVARASDGIKTPADFNGKKIGAWKSTQSLVRKFCRENNLRAEIIATEPGITPLLTRAMHVISANYYDEYEDLLCAGFGEKDLTVIKFSDLGLDLPEYCLYCRKETRETRPELCKAVASASLNGWVYAITNPADAARIITDYRLKHSLPTSYDRTLRMLQKVTDCLGENPQDAIDHLGILDKATYERITKKLAEDHIIEQVPPYEQFYQPAFEQEGGK